MRDKQFVCYVRNGVQKVLLEHEMLGQMYDGMWENSSQDYKLWHDTKFVVSTDGKLGTLGIPQYKKDRSRYNLNNRELLEIVGDRMIASARVCIAFPELVNSEEDSAIQHCAEEAMNTGKISPRADYDREYLRKVESLIGKENMGKFIESARNESLYDMKKMRKDLADLKKIMQMSIPEIE